MHSISGATQIKWSKLNENILATSHEGDVRIWDKRVKFIYGLLMIYFIIVDNSFNRKVTCHCIMFQHIWERLMA